jgi:hypothetical protein
MFLVADVNYQRALDPWRPQSPKQGMMKSFSSRVRVDAAIEFIVDLLNAMRT